MSLAPSIPLNDRTHFLEYWAENFTLVSDDNCNILVLNTAAYHGGGKKVAQEIEHGRISQTTIDKIKVTLERTRRAPVNIVLCHHHLIRPEWTDDDLVNQTRGGEKLIQLLNESDVAWIIVHGHKHVADLFYGHGGANAPVIFACASFSAQVNLDAQNKSPNQVHYLVCDPEGARAAGLTSAGTVSSWTWQPGLGWGRSQGLHGLRHLVGFGYRASVNSLVDDLEQELDAQGASQLPWTSAVHVLPALERLVPVDFVAFERVLNDRGLVILTEQDGSLAQIGRRT